MRKKIITILLGLTLIMLQGCTSMVKSHLGKGKEFKFTDKEGGKQTYYCKEVSSLDLPMKDRAEKSFTYFTKKNNEMSVALVKDLMEDKKGAFAISLEMNENAEKLAKDILQKYDCVLLDYEE